MTDVKNVEEAFESKMRDIEGKVRQAFDMDYDPEADIDLGVVYTFEDAVIVKDYATDTHILIEYSRVDDGVAFGEPKKVDMTFVTKRLMDENPNASVKTIQNIIDAWEDWSGSFTDCVASLSGKPGIDNAEALCAWLHYQAEGKWPAEKARAQKHGDHDQADHNPYGLGAGQAQECRAALAEFSAENRKKGGDKEKAKAADRASTKISKDGSVAGLPNDEADVLVEALDEHIQSLEDDPMADDDPDIKQELEDSRAALSKAENQAARDFDPDAEKSRGLTKSRNKAAKQRTKKRTKNEPELTGPIVLKNKMKRIAYAAVLVPGELDHDGEEVTAAKVEDSAHEWMEIYQNVDLQHSLNNVGVPVESYLLPSEMSVKAVDGEEMVLPKGTWILGSRLDEATWGAVEKGALTGYSVMGMKRAALKSAEKENDATAALKKTLLKDLGEDWVPVYVSVVNRPAVPKAKFFALKAAEPEPASWVDKLKGAVAKMSGNPAEKEGRRFSKATIDKMKAAYEVLMELIQEAEAELGEKDKSMKGGDPELTDEEIKQLVTETVNSTVSESVGEAVKSAVKPLQEEVEAMKSQPGPDGTGDQGDQTDNNDQTDSGDQGGSPDDSSQQSDQQNEALEAFKSEVDEKLDGFMEEISKKLGADSSALKGQDDGTGDQDADSKPPVRKVERIDRDLYGRRMQSRA